MKTDSKPCWPNMRLERDLRTRSQGSRASTAQRGRLPAQYTISMFVGGSEIMRVQPVVLRSDQHEPALNVVGTQVTVLASNAAWH
jgi:hypothetical protein